MAKNLCAKTVTEDQPYEVWERRSGGWKWVVLKKWQANDNEPFARWFCKTYSDMCPQGELGDVYANDIKRYAVRVK